MWAATVLYQPKHLDATAHLDAVNVWCGNEAVSTVQQQSATSSRCHGASWFNAHMVWEPSRFPGTNSILKESSIFVWVQRGQQATGQVFCIKQDWWSTWTSSVLLLVQILIAQLSKRGKWIALLPRCIQRRQGRVWIWIQGKKKKERKKCQQEKLRKLKQVRSIR